MKRKKAKKRGIEIGSPREIQSREVRIASLKQLRIFVKNFAKTLRGGEVIALSGPLGAGKTTFAQLLGKALGVGERITSPTFTLMHIHRTRKPLPSSPLAKGRGERLSILVHIDAYRLANARALQNIGALDYLGRPDTVAVVEWAEKVRRVLPRGTRWINFKIKSDGKSRELRIS
ncbi:tRNA (adenosine(37)-N6)-threonylcarbamoyltransferase complex ATPase subunit type 1 TsaE [Patescibacteria group bacterium]|nr:MAG: tRNA (adenosine(37)-N6)-threonylcarbamoyltransferase complex ATPase subunit type 1 TsaE [Patescibacteria group bacterium]